MRSLQELIDAGADLNLQCNAQNFSYDVGRHQVVTSAPLYTALHMAAEFNRPEACRLLINAGAGLFVKNEKGQTAFDIAREQENNCIVVFEQRDALYRALREDPQNDEVLSKDLIERIGCYAMEEEDGKSFIDGCLIYLKENEPSSARLTALIEFQKQAILDELEFLDQSENACALILKTDFIDESLDSRGSALHHFARLGSFEGVKLMLFRGAQINQKNDDGRTALMVAMKQGHSDLVQYLIEKNAHICIDAERLIRYITQRKIGSLFMSTNMLCKMAQELRLNDNQVKETLLGLYPIAPDALNFLKKFKAICRKLQLQHLDSVIEDLIKTEQMHVNLLTIVDFLDMDNTQYSTLGKRNAFFSDNEDTWAAQIRQLFTRVKEFRANRQEGALDVLCEEYQKLVVSMPSDVREWVSIITNDFPNDLPEALQKRLKM